MDKGEANMNKKANYTTIKWIVSVSLSVLIGTTIMTILGNIGLNVWITRIAGAFCTAITGLIIYYLWIKSGEK